MDDKQVQDLEERLSHLRSQLIGLRDTAQAAVIEISGIRHWMNEITVENLKAQLEAETKPTSGRKSK